MANASELVYFERWLHPRADELLKGEQAVEIRRIAREEPADLVAAALASARWYQLSSTRGEIPEEYRASPGLFARAPNILAVSCNGAGYDTIDVDACTRAGVIAVNQAGGNREAVAEHALGMMLSLSKRMPEADRAMRNERGWVRTEFTGRDIFGKTVGIVGLGHVGQRLADIVRAAFEMRVVAYDPYVPAETFEQHGAERAASLEELLSSADFVSVHCPRTAETEGMLGAAQFAAMRPSAYLVNTARGGIIDEDALAEALIAGQLAGAGIDAWDEEPPPLDHPLLRLDNVIATPHTAGVTLEAREQMAIRTVEQWQAIWRGERPPRLLNPEAWPRYCERFQEAFGRPVIG